jgi:hypothetical protein
VGTRGTPGVALRREMGAGAQATCGGSGVFLSQETGAGAQATRGGPGAALSREVGTTPPPLLPRLSWAVRAWRRPDQAVVASTRPPPYSGCHPPLHDFDDHDHIDLDYLGIKGLSSACGTCRFLL